MAVDLSPSSGAPAVGMSVCSFVMNEPDGQDPRGREICHVARRCLAATDSDSVDISVHLRHGRRTIGADWAHEHAVPRRRPVRDPQGRRRPDGQQRLRAAVHRDRRRRAARRRQRARPAARPVPGASTCARCSRPTATGTTSRPCPQLRDAGYEVHVTAEDAGMLPSYDQILEDDSVVEVGRLRLRTIHTPGPHAGVDVLPRRGVAGAVQRRHAVPRRARATRRSPAATSPRSSTRSRTSCSRSRPRPRVLPGHGDPTTIGTERPHLQEWIDRGW